MSSRVLPAVVLLLALAAAAATPVQASDCAVPCGYIYPLLVLSFPDYDGVNPVDVEGGERVLEGSLTYRFDVTNEGYGLQDPQQEIRITFEFPKKPAWVDVSMEPAEIPILVLPIYIVPDVSNPASPVANFVYTAPIALTVRATADAPDDAVFSKALVFAKSTESGLYKAAYGIKEVRVATGVTEEEILARASVGPEETPGFHAMLLMPAVAAALLLARRVQR